MLSDAAHYRFLAPNGASLQTHFVNDPPRLVLLGNRAGILGIANVLLWLYANSFRREMLSIRELPFVSTGVVNVLLRLTDVRLSAHHGLVQGREDNIEWLFGDSQLLKVALLCHHLACVPEHEYDLLALESGSSMGVEIRLRDLPKSPDVHEHRP